MCMLVTTPWIQSLASFEVFKVVQILDDPSASDDQPRKFVSLIQPDNRTSQNGDNRVGTEQKYTLGETYHDANGEGFYCYASRAQAEHVASHFVKLNTQIAVLRCLVPINSAVRYGENGLVTVMNLHILAASRTTRDGMATEYWTKRNPKWR